MIHQIINHQKIKKLKNQLISGGNRYKLAQNLIKTVGNSQK
jgi:hypothetical protein